MLASQIVNNIFEIQKLPQGASVEYPLDVFKKPDISIFCGAIRQENWQRLYDSCQPACGQHSFELVLAGPYAPSLELISKGNVQWVETWRCPTAAYQQAALVCQSDLIVYVSDDGWLLPDVLGENIELLKSRRSSVYSYLKDVTNPKYDVVVAKYIEGNKSYPDASYYLHYHDAVRHPTYPPSHMLFNLPVMWKDFFLELGGFDAINFPSHAMGFCDFGVRAQNAGANISFERRNMLEVTQCPGECEEHLPIHIQQTQYDEKRYREIYSKPEAVERKFIDINNWWQTEERWTRRFGSK